MKATVSNELNYKYILDGKPLSYIASRFYGRTFYDAQRAQQRHNEISLENQHDGQPLFKGPLKIKMNFYFAPLISKAVLRRNINNPYIKRCSLSDLVKFVERIGIGILYQRDALIYTVCASKLYDEKPRTEFSIQNFTKKVLEEGKNDKNKKPH